MATQPEGQTDALTARIAASRDTVGHGLGALRYRLDVPARVRDSFLSKPLVWFAGSLGAGLLASMLIRRRPPTVVHQSKSSKSFWKLALGGAFALARPTLQAWAIRELGKRFDIPGNDSVRDS